MNSEEQAMTNLQTILSRLQTYPYVSGEARFVSQMVCQVINTLLLRPIHIEGLTLDQSGYSDPTFTHDSLGRPLPPGAVELAPGVVHHSPNFPPQPPGAPVPGVEINNPPVGQEVSPITPHYHQQQQPQQQQLPPPQEPVNQWRGPDGTEVQQTQPMVPPQGQPIAAPIQPGLDPGTVIAEMQAMKQEIERLQGELATAKGNGVGSSNSVGSSNTPKKTKKGKRKGKANKTRALHPSDTQGGEVGKEQS